MTKQPDNRGGKRAGAGRPKGTTGRPHRLKTDVPAVVERVKAMIADGETPVEFFLRVMRDPKKSHSQRHDAAVAAAPYVHKKQPMDVNVDATGFPTPQPTVLIVNVGVHLSDDTRAS